MEPKTEYQIAYMEYLRSPEWKDKRLRVMRRDGYMCTACGNAPATEVHHESYEYGRYTPLWMLHAVCRPCHQVLTDVERNGQYWDFGGLDAALPY